MSNQSQESFPAEVIERLKYYVYRLIDPRDGETFYVGHGEGNSVFDHARGIVKYDSESEQITRINTIRECGLQVAHVIHRHGLSKEVAWEVSEALIAAYPATSNGRKNHGVYHSIELEELFGDFTQSNENKDLQDKESELEEHSFSPTLTDLLGEIAKYLGSSIDEINLIKDIALEHGYIDLGDQTYASVLPHFSAHTYGNDPSPVLSIVKSLAIRKRKNIAVFSSGITNKEIAFRLVCAEANLSKEGVRSGTLNVFKFSVLINAVSKILGTPIGLMDLPLLSVETIRTKYQSLRLNNPLSLLVVYNVSLISTDYNVESSKRKFDKFLKELKALGSELNIPIIFKSETRIET